MMRLQKRCDMVSPVLAVAVASALLSACVEPTQAIDERRIPIEIGSAAVTVVIHKADEGGLTFVNLHDDENTAVEATLDVLQTDGGRLIELQHTGERNVSFSLDGTEYAFDPNRMFTDGGIDSTLARNGASSQAAHAAVETFADSVLSLIDLDQLPTVVTVHNNSEEGYSARSYADGGSLARDARFVHFVAGTDPDDFFFVTTENLYNDLRAADFNVVMQDNALVTDDGSLSVLCGYREIPYANAEAQHGHFEEQRRMLTFLAKRHASDL